MNVNKIGFKFVKYTKVNRQKAMAYCIFAEYKNNYL